MRSLGIFLVAICYLASGTSIDTLPSRVAEVLQPYIKGANEDSLIRTLYSPTSGTYRWKQEKAIHLLLDGIVKEVNANLAVVDEHFEHEKELIRSLRANTYNRLEMRTAEADKLLDELKANLDSAEKRKTQADETYDEKLGAKTAAAKLVIQRKKEEKDGKSEADRIYTKRHAEIEAEHNETRQQYVDELMFVAKLRQMIEQLNVEFKHKRGAGATAAPTVSPTPAPTIPTPAPTASPTPSPTLMNNLGGTNGWRMVSREVAHHQGLLTDLGRNFGFYDSQTLNMGPTFKYGRDYTEVAVSWGSKDNYVKFIASGDVFDDHVHKNMKIWHVTSSVPGADKYFDGEMGSLCRAAAQPGGGSHPNSHRYLPGLTSWAITPRSDENRQCGCSSPGEKGVGFYYGGNPVGCNDGCQCRGGGFTGFVTNGQAHSDVTLGKTVSIWVRKGKWRVLSGCHATEDGKIVTKTSPTTSAEVATAVAATPAIGVSASPTATNTHVTFGLTLLEQGGIMSAGAVVPTWGMKFGGGQISLYEFGNEIKNFDMHQGKDKFVLGDRAVRYKAGTVGRIEIEGGYPKAYLDNVFVHSFNTKIDSSHETTYAQFSFIEDNASVNVENVRESGYWKHYPNACQGNNRNCEQKTVEQCINDCHDDETCSLYMYNEKTGGCCQETCYPPDYSPPTNTGVPTCNAWIANCTEGWSSYVKELPKA